MLCRAQKLCVAGPFASFSEVVEKLETAEIVIIIIVENTRRLNVSGLRHGSRLLGHKARLPGFNFASSVVA